MATGMQVCTFNLNELGGGDYVRGHSYIIRCTCHLWYAKIAHT